MTNKLLMAAFMALGLCQTAKAQTMKEALGKYFLVGAAVNTNVVYGIDNKGANVVKENFNAIVAENCMKGEEIHPLRQSALQDEVDLHFKVPERPTCKSSNVRCKRHCDFAVGRIAGMRGCA